MYDILIRGGDVIDGTGSARRRADVGIQGDRIVAIGELEEAAATTIDATDKVVAPGFVDVHTHYDAQVFWDGALTPSPLHGVTTALAGNCGFTIAPLSDDAADGDYLMRMLARVEGMPLESLRAGVPWNWKTTAEYFDEIEGRLGINAGFMVGHSAIRRVVMGEESTTRESKPEELEAMQALLRAGLDAGALGFSSSWARTHNDADGHMVPSRYASRDEIVDLCSTLSQYEGTSLEFIPMVGPFEPWAVELMASMSAAAQRPLNWNVLGVSAKTLADAERKLEAGDYARAHGGRVVALTVPMSFPIYLSFRSGFVLDAMPGWEDVMGLPLDEKLKFFDDKDALARLDAQAQGENNPMRGLANWGNLKIHDVVAAENADYRGRMVGEIAEAEGRSAWDVLTSIARADELNTSFGTVAAQDTDEDWKARIQVWRDRRALDRCVGRRRPPRPACLVQLRDRSARQGRPSTQAAAARRGHQPDHRHACPALRAEGAGADRRRVEGRRGRPRPRDHRQPRRAHAHGSPRGRRSALRRGRRHRAGDRQRFRHRA